VDRSGTDPTSADPADLRRMSLLHGQIPEGFELRMWVVASGESVAYDPGEWAGSLVTVEDGEIELECDRGGRRRFGPGTMLAPEVLGLVALHGCGPEPTVLAALSRRRDADADVGVGPRPPADLRHLDRLVGTWHLAGRVVGAVTYEWTEGGPFLLLHVDLDDAGRRIQGLEVIGRHPDEARGGADEGIPAHFYDSNGDVQLHIYELDGDTLVVWRDERGSTASFRGTFTPDGSVIVGQCTCTTGDMFEVVLTRADDPPDA
jgi:hypothetical protein